MTKIETRETKAKIESFCCYFITALLHFCTPVKLTRTLREEEDEKEEEKD
jgi:hypothetical protein